MAWAPKQSWNGNGIEVTDCRNEETRKNIPLAKIAAEGRVPAASKVMYSYNPRLNPTLHFHGIGKADHLPEHSAISDDEAHVLAEALRVQEALLEWAGKHKTKGVESRSRRSAHP